MDVLLLFCCFFSIKVIYIEFCNRDSSKVFDLVQSIIMCVHYINHIFKLLSTKIAKL